VNAPRTDAAEGGLRPLNGVRIVDFSSNIAGPFATMILAQLGADVIKVESPEGDDSRFWSVHAGVSLVHRYVNAGKRGVVLDLKTAEGLTTARQLCSSANVVLQSMRPGVAERLGIDAEALLKLNPDLLCYDLSGYGSGEEGQRLPGYDPLVQAYCGIMAMNGHDGDAPARCAPSVIDLGTGQWIAIGILAAIMSGQKGRRVARIETALVDTAFSLVAYQATGAKMTGQRPPKAGSGNPIAAPYSSFPASDGDLLIAAPSQRLWEKLAKALEAPELVADLRYLGPTERVANRVDLDADLSRILSTNTVDHWIARLRSEGVPVALVAGLEQAVEGPIARERGTFAELDGAPLVRLPWTVDGHPVPWTRPAPKLGEHTAEIMAELNQSDNKFVSVNKLSEEERQ
jgi:crotonobetainyl-CoA:carnitine CoA-transferase CaiB-like acyl-CoA transferase